MNDQPKCGMCGRPREDVDQACPSCKANIGAQIERNFVLATQFEDGMLKLFTSTQPKE